MNDYDDTRVEMPKAVVEKWARTAGEAPLQKPPIPPKKSAKERKETRHEWREALLCIISIAFDVYLMVHAIELLHVPSFVYPLALLHPLLIFIFYHKKYLEPYSQKGNQGIALLLFVASISSLLFSIRLPHLHFPNLFSFLLPSILTAAAFFLYNHYRKRKTGRYLSLLIMMIWIPFYMFAFPLLCTIALPSLHTERIEAKITMLSYDGEGTHTMKMALPHTDTLAEFVISKQEAKTYQVGEILPVELKQGILGISYMQLDFQ